MQTDAWDEDCWCDTNRRGQFALNTAEKREISRYLELIGLTRRRSQRPLANQACTPKLRSKAEVSNNGSPITPE
jgi:hypothetical protein